LTTRYDEDGVDDYLKEEFTWKSGVCLSCGWWWEGTLPGHSWSRGCTLAGVLHKTQSLPEPMREGLKQLRNNSARLYRMEPTRFEKFVQDLMSAYYSCEIVHCGKSHDGGIDLLLLDSDAGRIPIQVKRRSRPGSVESVSLIREFRGALLLSGYDRGIVVTTADHFSEEAIEASLPRPEHLVYQEVDLIDCRRLLQIIQALSSGNGVNLQALCTFNLLGDYGRSPGHEVLKRIEISLRNFSNIVAKIAEESSPQKFHPRFSPKN
jgi:hypothetical protein